MAAMNLFSRHGFSETTVEEITRAADVGKGTFFNYFPSKEHVLGFLVSKQAGAVEQHLALARLGSTSCDRVLISLGRSLVKFPGKSPQMARSLMSAFLGNTEVREYVVRELTEKRQWIAEIISLGQERGELNSELPAADLARAFHHALFGTVLMWALDPSSPLEKQFSNTMQTFLSGLNASSKTRPRARQEVLPKALGRKQSEVR
jgi:AcrR family transcriptional regulator